MPPSPLTDGAIKKGAVQRLPVAHTLVIVESPTKARTIRGFLPKDFRVEASMGHVRDLPNNASEIPAAHKGEKWANLGVKTANDFEPLYVVPKDKKKVVKELKDALKGADQLLLAATQEVQRSSGYYRMPAKGGSPQALIYADKMIGGLIKAEMFPVEVRALLQRFALGWERFSRLGFYRTDDLDAEASRTGMRVGASAVIAAYAVRLGFEIVSVDPIRVNDAGTDLEVHPGNRADPATWSSVRFGMDRDGRRIILDYVRADLSDRGLGRAPSTRAWIERMAGNRTLLKAASHLLQKSSFSIIREAILARAPSVVQDETGIDYGLLARVHAVDLYGNFVKPIPLFQIGRAHV